MVDSAPAEPAPAASAAAPPSASAAAPPAAAAASAPAAGPSRGGGGGGDGTGTAVQVAVRVRPFLEKEAVEGARECTKVIDSRQVVLGKNRAFTFDTLFGPSTEQADVYAEAVAPLMRQFLRGINCTILAYGQTGTGKTHTMGTGDLTDVPEADQGIVPRAVGCLFEHIEARQRESTPERQVTVKCKASYIEIYNESLRDLLRPQTPAKAMQIREDTRGGITVSGVHEEDVASVDDMLAQLDVGTVARSTGSTLMNHCSSRSHSILTIVLEQTVQRNDGTPAEFTCAKLHLVDLAGSERNKKTGASGQRFKESVSINSGLLALGNVISVLGEQSKAPEGKRVHVPYRDSKLTRLLQDSLGGNATTLIVACISPADTNIEESLNTLKYANRAKNIRNKPIVNRDPHSMLTAQLRAELAAMKRLLERNGIAFDAEAAGSGSGGGGGGGGSAAGNSLVTPDGAVWRSEDVLLLRSERAALEKEAVRLRGERRQHCCWAELEGPVREAVAAAAADDAERAVLLSCIEAAVRRRGGGGGGSGSAGNTPNGRGGSQGRAGGPLSRQQPNTPIVRRKQPTTPAGSSGGGGSAGAGSGSAGGTSPHDRRVSSSELREMIPASMLLTGHIPASVSDNIPDQNAPPHVISQCVDQVISENQKLLRNVKQLEDDLYKSECQSVAETEERTKLQSAFTAAAEENEQLKHQNAMLAKKVSELRTQESPQEGLDRLRDEVQRLAQERTSLYEAKRRTELERKRLENSHKKLQVTFAEEQKAMQDGLKALAADIEEKTSMIEELCEKEKRMNRVQHQNERTIQLMETEKERLKQELDKALRKLEQSDHSADKLERMKVELCKQYESRLKEQDSSLQGLRKKQRDAQALLRQHDADYGRMQKLLAEVSHMRKHQADLRNAIKCKTDERDQERDQRQRQLSELQRQIGKLEAQNVKYSTTLRTKEESLGRLQQQLNLEKTKTKQLTEQQVEIRREVVKKQSWLDKEIEVQRRHRDAQERLQRELRRRERILKEREDNQSAREEVVRARGQHDATRLERGLQGWDSQIASISAKMEAAQKEVDGLPESARHSGDARFQELGRTLAALAKQLASARANHQEISNAQAEAAKVDNQLRQLDDRLDVLQATLEYGEDIILQTENEIEALAKADEDIKKNKTGEEGGGGGGGNDRGKENVKPASPQRQQLLQQPGKGGGGGAGGAAPSSRSPSRSPQLLLSEDDILSLGSGGAGGGGDSGKLLPTPDQYQQTLQQYALKVQSMSKSEQDKDRAIRDLKLQCDDRDQTVDRLKNALKLADMAFNRRLLKVQLEHEQLLSRLMVN